MSDSRCSVSYTRLSLGFTGGVNITTPEQTVQEAQGETAHLPCMFTLSPEDQGPLFIDWMLLTGPENEVVNRMVSVPCACSVSLGRRGIVAGRPTAQACEHG